MARIKGRGLPIFDRATIASEARSAIDERYAGSESQAAVAIGWSRTTLRRLLACTLTTVRRDKVRGLKKLLGNTTEATRTIRRCVALLPQPESKRKYEAWLSNERRRFAGNSTGIKGVPPRELLQRLERRFPSHFARLQKAIDNAGLTAARVDLLRRELLAPLLAHEQSGRVERSITELDVETLLHFLDASITRAIIIIDREPDRVRLQGTETTWGVAAWNGAWVANVLSSTPAPKGRKPLKVRSDPVADLRLAEKAKERDAANDRRTQAQQLAAYEESLSDVVRDGRKRAAQRSPRDLSIPGPNDYHIVPGDDGKIGRASGLDDRP